MTISAFQGTMVRHGSSRLPLVKRDWPERDPDGTASELAGGEPSGFNLSTRTRAVPEIAQRVGAIVS